MEARSELKKDERTRSWLSFIDKDQYSNDMFLDEAAILGAIFRVNLQVLKVMRWGDQVCSFSSMRTLSSAWLLGTWPITKILGVTTEASRAILAKRPAHAIDFGGKRFVRKIGWYDTGISYKTAAHISEIAETLQLFLYAGGDIGDVMVGCGPGVLKRLKKPVPIFHELPKQHIRPFDFDSAMGAMGERESRKHPRVAGQFLMPEMYDPDILWDDNPPAVVPPRNFMNMEGGLVGGILETWINYKAG